MRQDQLQTIISQAQSGRDSGFDELISAYHKRLYSYFYRSTANQHQAEDLLQELFLRVVKSIKRYNHRDNFDAWIYRIATNLLRDRIRKAVRLQDKLRQFDAGATEVDVSPDPAEQLANCEQYDQLQVAIQKLTAEQREVLLLRYYSGLSFQQIATMLGRPTGTVLSQGHRGVKKLRELLERYCDD